MGGLVFRERVVYNVAMDQETRVEELQALVRKFRDERDWEQFHDPKNLAEDLIIEAGELLEQFLWKDKERVAKDLANPEMKEAVEEELVDVLHCVLLLAIATDTDLSSALQKKMLKNALKYPVEKARGRFEKYTKL